MINGAKTIKTTSKTLQRRTGTELYLKILKRTLIYSEIPKEFYGIKENKEEAICLTRFGSGWAVYHYERGNKYEERRFKELKSACVNMIERLAPDEKSKDILLNNFYKLIESNTSQEKPNYQEVRAPKSKNHGNYDSPDAQIAILTERIAELTEHLKENPKDHHSRRSLLNMVGQRRGLLDYLKKTNPTEYCALIEKLGIRR